MTGVQTCALPISFSGIGGALGALYAGYSWQTLGAAYTFASAGAVALLAAFIMLFGLSRSKSVPVTATE